jgi:hypothetical protein
MALPTFSLSPFLLFRSLCLDGLITSFGVVAIINILAIMGLEWRNNDKLYILYLYGILLLSILFVPGRMREFLPPLIGLF